MSFSTDISWTDSTWNPWQGCDKVSPACANCYMYRDKIRYGQDPSVVVRSSPATFNAPLARYGPRSKHGAAGTWKWPDGQDVFTASWSDFFHPEADAWRGEAWEVIRQRPGLRFFVLTKRPELIPGRLPEGWPFPNVLLGVTVENADYLWRIARLLEVPAVGRFVSAEPLLGPLEGDEDAEDLIKRLDWVICGGESGPKSRPTHAEWIRGLRDLTQTYKIPFHFKQWGEWIPTHLVPAFFAGKAIRVSIDDAWFSRIGIQAAGRTLDGREHNDRPLVGR